jgi:dTDP-4-amino-4,6-dideoxygalactose transaminase
MRHVEYENLHFLNRPFFEDYRASFNDILERGWYILGKNVENFEKQFADYIGAKYVIGVASGLDALEIPLKCWGFEPRSEIIVPSNTYIATINAIINCGHIPVFVEPDIDSYNIDCQRIEEKITSKTRAIMLVHLYGRSCQMDAIMALCETYKLELVEDCAQSHGSTFDGKMTGSFGVGAFSFYPTKNLGALGDAGAIATNDEVLYRKMKAWRNYGSNIKYKNEYIGDNSRLDEMQAGFLTIKLNHLDEISKRKNEIAQYYLKNLNPQFILPSTDERIYNVYHIFPIRHPNRDALKAYLLEKGIKTEIHYPTAACDQKSIQDWAKHSNITIDENDFTLAREIHATELSLPISTIHSDEDIAYIVKIMNEFNI